MSRMKTLGVEAVFVSPGGKQAAAFYKNLGFEVCKNAWLAWAPQWGLPKGKRGFED